MLSQLIILFLLSICTVKKPKHRLVLDHLVHHLPLGHGLPLLDVLPVPDPDTGHTVCEAPLTQDLPGPVFFTIGADRLGRKIGREEFSLDFYFCFVAKIRYQSFVPFLATILANLVAEDHLQIIQC